MSCIIHIETEKTAVSQFNFIWSISGADWNTDEIHRTWTLTNDRLRAAIVNLGLTCRCLKDNDVFQGTVQIKSDTDGLDQRYNGEHNALYALISPVDELQGQKLRSIYFEYMKYVGRIKQLQMQNRIRIELI